MVHCAYLFVCCQWVSCKQVCNLYKFANCTVWGKWRLEFQQCEPPIWPWFFVSKQCWYAACWESSLKVRFLSSPSIAAHSWPYLWRLEMKNRGQIGGSCGWNSALERRLRVWAPGRGSFSPIANSLAWYHRWKMYSTAPVSCPRQPFGHITNSIWQRCLKRCVQATWHEHTIMLYWAQTAHMGNFPYVNNMDPCSQFFFIHFPYDFTKRWGVNRGRCAWNWNCIIAIISVIVSNTENRRRCKYH